MSTSLNPNADPWSPITPMLPHILYLPPPPPPPPYIQQPLTLFHHPMQLYNINYFPPPFHHPKQVCSTPNTGHEKMDDPYWDAASFRWTGHKKVETFSSTTSVVTKVWKKKVGNEASGTLKHVVNFADDEGRTSVMIRNIPNKFRREEFLKFLDLYCNSYQLEYDFVYLPMDFMSHNNFGYAFVNFTTSYGALKIMSLLEGHKWRDSLTNLHMKTSKKTCQINWARIQGKAELVKHFQQITFLCDESEYLPVVFSPPRNGSTCLSTPSTIGKLGGNPPRKSSL